MANRFKQICGNRGYGILSKTLYLLYNIVVSSLNFLRHTAQEGSRKTICRIVMSLYLVSVSRKYCVSIPFNFPVWIDNKLHGFCNSVYR